jgi:hypothetical protein
VLPNVDSIAARLRLKQLRLLIALDEHGLLHCGMMSLRSLFEREFKEAGLPVPPHSIETASTMTTVLMLSATRRSFR